jgi:hypothetical protein
MPGFDRTGGGRGLCNPRGIGGGFRGAGSRGYFSPWPYVGRGRGGYARYWYPGFAGAYAAPYPGRDQEIDELKSQAQAMREQLAGVEEAIKQLSQES